MSTTTVTKVKNTFKAHVHLEQLIKKRFGVILEIRHSEFDKRYPHITEGGNHVIGMTQVWAFKNKEDAAKWRTTQNTSLPIAQSVSKCGIGDTFKKSVGLTRSLNRLYKTLKQKA